MEGGVEMKGKGCNFPLCEEGESVLLSLQCAVLLKGGEMKGRGKVAACCRVCCAVLPAV